MTEIDYTARVQRGAALLDEKWPTWATDIDLERLDIAFGDVCMTAQYAQHHGFGNYWQDAIGPLGLEDEDEDYRAHGFDVADDLPNPAAAYNTLNRLWRDLITERRSAAQPEASGR